MPIIWFVQFMRVLLSTTYRCRLLAALVVLVLEPSYQTAGQGLRLLGLPLDSLLHVKNPPVNKSYIATYYSRFHLYLVSDRQAYGIQLRTNSQILHYKPNLFWALGLGFDYKWANTQLTLRVPFLSDQPAQKGKTKPFGVSLMVNTNNRQLWITGQYQSYRGFYVANPDKLEANWLSNHSTYPLRPDLGSQTITTHIEYLFNPLRVSIPASLLQREGQRRAAGSWVLGSFLTYHHLSADSTFVPPGLQIDFAPELRATHFHSVALGVDGGYRQMVILGKGFFLTLSVQPGISLLAEYYTMPGSLPERRIYVGWQGLGACSLGYSSATYYGGIYGTTLLANQAVVAGLVRTDAEYVRVVVGKRIPYSPKGILKKVPGLQ